MCWIKVTDNLPQKGQKCFLKGPKGAYYAGIYSGKDIANKDIFWVPCANRYVRANYYIKIPE